MKHDIYKLAEQYHLNESEQQMFQSLLEAADQNIQYSVREFAARNYVSPAALIRLSKKMGYIWLYGYGISTGISGTE